MSKSKSPQYDPQRQEVYRMEKQGLYGLNRSRLHRDEHATLVSMACSKFGVKSPRIRYEASPKWAGWYGADPHPTVTLSTCYSGGLSAMTLLHELAHYLVHVADPHDYLEPHGPEFLGVYGDLMEATGFVVRGSWRLLTKEYGVKTMRTGSLEPRELLAAIKKRAAKAARKSPPPTDE